MKSISISALVHYSVYVGGRIGASSPSSLWSGSAVQISSGFVCRRGGSFLGGGYSGFRETCHPRSFPLPTFFHFPQYEISQLSTSKYRAVVQQSKSYNSLCTKFKRVGVLWIASPNFLNFFWITWRSWACSKHECLCTRLWLHVMPTHSN
jgi:hypothetical protein